MYMYMHMYMHMHVYMYMNLNIMCMCTVYVDVHADAHVHVYVDVYSVNCTLSLWEYYIILYIYGNLYFADMKFKSIFSLQMLAICSSLF